MEENYIIVGEKGDEVYSEVLECREFSDFMFNATLALGDKPYIIDGVTDEYITFKEVSDKASVLAASLLRFGILPGETITISCENRMEFPTVMLASVFVGAVFNPINPVYKQDEIVHILSVTKPRIIFCSSLTYKNIMSTLQQLRGVCHMVLLDDLQTCPTMSIVKYNDLLKCNPIDKRYQPRDDDIAGILTSSGTTGLPKGVMFSYKNLKYFMSRVSSSESRIRNESVILGLVPMFHGYGWGLLMATITVGSKFILLPRFEEKLFLSTIEKYKVTNLFMVPPLMVFMAKSPLVKQYDLSSVIQVSCAAAPLSPETSAEVKARLPQADFRQAYGLTESTIFMTLTPLNCNRPNSVGKLLQGLEVKIEDIETGRPLGRNKAGEIVVRGPNVMVGYCNNPQATKEAIDDDGWLHTGDVGYVDNEGFFYIVDRIKELIKYKAYQVAPAELEAILLGMSGVRDAAVVGLPDLAAGELPIAFVVLQPDSTLKANDIMNYVNGKVSPQKKIRQVRFIDAIPRNPSGKILRRVLKESLRSNI